MIGTKMPNNYIAEMIMDRIAASKVYLGEKYTDKAPLDYYRKGTEQIPLHPYTKEWMERLLKMLAEEGEEKTYRFIRKEILHK